MTKKYYWAGFCDDKIYFISELYGENSDILAIFRRKKDAKTRFCDVRKIEIKEVKHNSGASHK